MLKASVIRVSLLCALVPLAAACAQAEPGSGLPEELMSQAPQEEALSHGSGHDGFKLYPSQAQPFGKSYETWAAEWWQWLFAIPAAVNPELGGPCDVDQSGKVFFLAGNWGGTTTRSCTIPKDKAIFFPVVNAVLTSCPENSGGGAACEDATSEQYLHDTATWVLDQDKTMSLEIDGVAVEDLEDYRAQTATFHAPAPASDPMSDCLGPIRDNPCGVPVGTPRNAVSDGHWIMLHPLPPGAHQIHFAAGVPSFQFSLDITYNIVVAP